MLRADSALLGSYTGCTPNSKATSAMSANGKKELFPGHRGARSEGILDDGASFAASCSRGRALIGDDKSVLGLSNPEINPKVAPAELARQHSSDHAKPTPSKVTPRRGMNGSWPKYLAKWEADKFLDRLAMELFCVPCRNEKGTEKKMMLPETAYHVMKILTTCHSRQEGTLPPRPTALGMWDLSERHQGDGESPASKPSTPSHMEHDANGDKKDVSEDAMASPQTSQFVATEID
jgi:hypothetical protein